MRTDRGLSPRTSRREPSGRATTRPPWRPVAIIAALGAAVLLVAGIWMLLPRPVEVEARSVQTATPTAPATTADAQPAPERSIPVPTAVAARDASITAAGAGAVDAPSEVRVPSIELTLGVVPVGVRDDGQMDVPDLVQEMGWYRFGPAPGDPRGSAVLAAHVDSDVGEAPMAAVLDAVPGSDVEVTTVGGEQLRFRITSIEQVSKDELPLDALFARDGDPLLRLVTCGGEWDPAAGAYEDNIVVTAVPADP